MRDVEPATRGYVPRGTQSAGQGYSSYAPAGRAPASDPFAARSRALGSAQAAESMMAASSVAARSTPALPAEQAYPGHEAAADETLELDRPFNAALIDLALVEQAVQAELATVAEEAQASAAHDAVGRDASAREMAADVSEAGPDSDQAESAEAESFEATTITEAADMQVNAKPTAVQRPAAEHTEDRRPLDARPTEARPDARATEPRMAETGAPFPRASASRQAQEPVAPLDPVRERLVSGTTNSAVSAAFGSLARTVASNSRTVDDLVSEAIRPMLKEWLDENLPTLVERLVRAEIERVARQGQ